MEPAPAPAPLGEEWRALDSGARLDFERRLAVLAADLMRSRGTAPGQGLPAAR